MIDFFIFSVKFCFHPEHLCVCTYVRRYLAISQLTFVIEKQLNCIMFIGFFLNFKARLYLSVDVI